MKQFDRLDLNLPHMLVAVPATRSLSRAGTLPGLSQPASSIALVRVREALADPPFAGTRDGMVATTDAESVVPRFRANPEGIRRTIRDEETFNPIHAETVFALSLSGLGETMPLRATSAPCPT